MRNIFGRLTLGVVLVAIISLPIAAYAKQTRAGDADALETRVYLKSQCLLGSATDQKSPAVFGAIAAIIVPYLIERAIGGIGSALTKAGSEETLTVTSRRPLTLFKLMQSVEKPPELKMKQEFVSGCVIVVRGRFSGPENLDARINYSGGNGIFKSVNQRSLRIARLRNNGIPVSSIALVYEAQIISSDDMTAVRYESKFLEVTDFQGDRSKKKGRNIVMGIGFNGVGAKEEGEVNSLVLINVGKITIDRDSDSVVLGPIDLEAGKYKSGWVRGFAITKDEFEKLLTVQTDNREADVLPLTLVGSITETESGNAALRFIGEVLEATKKDVSTAIGKEIFKDRASEADKKAKENETLLQAEESAYAKYLGALIALSNSVEKKNKVYADQKSTFEAKKAAADDVILKTFELEAANRAWCVKFREVLDANLQPVGARDAGC